MSPTAQRRQVAVVAAEKEKKLPTFEKEKKTLLNDVIFIARIPKVT